MGLAPKAQVLGAEASRDILKFRVSEMAFPGVSKRYFLPQMLCCFVRIHATLIATGKCDGYTPPWAYKIQTGRKGAEKHTSNSLIFFLRESICA